MKNVFVSIPMNGKHTSEIKAGQKQVFDLYAQTHTDEQYQLMDTCLTLDVPNNVINTNVYYFGHSIIELSKADLVLFVPGWENIRGCKLEHDIAVAYGIPTVEL